MGIWGSNSVQYFLSLDRSLAITGERLSVVGGIAVCTA
ncbi:hypothetical protein JCM19238_3779 [Vibrio ponticus]|nr:hypothetical protein JCM19238_3779 [Vibrio ponticus]